MKGDWKHVTCSSQHVKYVSLLSLVWIIHNAFATTIAWWRPLHYTVYVKRNLTTPNLSSLKKCFREYFGKPTRPCENKLRPARLAESSLDQQTGLGCQPVVLVDACLPSSLFSLSSSPFLPVLACLAERWFPQSGAMPLSTMCVQVLMRVLII